MKQLITSAFIAAITIGSAYAANAPAPETEERGFPLALVLSLFAVFCALGASYLAASKKKKDGDPQ